MPRLQKELRAFCGHRSPTGKRTKSSSACRCPPCRTSWQQPIAQNRGNPEGLPTTSPGSRLSRWVRRPSSRGARRALQVSRSAVSRARSRYVSIDLRTLGGHAVGRRARSLSGWKGWRKLATACRSCRRAAMHHQRARANVIRPATTAVDVRRPHQPTDRKTQQKRDIQPAPQSQHMSHTGDGTAVAAGHSWPC
jgi:hypothetical protein